MNNRIKILRNALNKSQEEFGKILGLSKSGVCEIESGRRNVTEQHIIMLRNYNDPNGWIINEEWIRTGNGEMLLQKSRKDDIADLTLKLLKDEKDSFRNRLVSVLARLSEDEWEMLEKRFREVIED